MDGTAGGGTGAAGAGDPAGRPGRWASLFSGGKDSSWALYRALAAGLDVASLVTVHPPPDSYVYHVPATRLAGLAAESVGLPLVEVEREAFGPDATGEAGPAGESGARGDAEMEPLAAALAGLDDDLDGGLAGVTVGAVESEFQHSRVEAVCERLGCGTFAPLWRADPAESLAAMLDAGFQILVVGVAAAGLEASWLGRTLDRDALADLRALHERHGVHLMGEGGEYETLVTDGPHMDRPIELDWTVDWDGTRGELEITDARLG